MQRICALTTASGGLSETISDGKFMTRAFCHIRGRSRAVPMRVSPLVALMVFLCLMASAPLFAGPSQGTQLELNFYGAASQHDLGLLRDGERKWVQQAGHRLELTRKADVLELSVDGQVLAAPSAQGGIKVQQADMHCQVQIGAPGSGAPGSLKVSPTDPTVVLKRSGGVGATKSSSPASKKPEETLVMEDGSDTGGGCEDDPKPKCDDDAEQGAPKAGTTKDVSIEKVIIEKKIVAPPGSSEGPTVMIRCIKRSGGQVEEEVRVVR